MPATPITFARLDARAILDSRGYPTLEVRATLDDGARLIASVPAGASTGEHEAVELRDRGPAYSGRGVDGAVAGVNGEIADLLTGRT